MRILQVIPYFYPAWRFGGPVRVAYDISRKLVERGHSVSVYTTDIIDDNVRVNTFYGKVEGVHVYYFKNLSLYAAKRRLYVTPSLVSAVRDSVGSFDVVHIHGNRTTQGPILHHFLRKNKVPYVVQAHGGLPNASGYGLKRLYDLFFGYRLLRDASKVLALTQKEAEQYECMGVPKKKIEIVPNGIDLTEYSDLPPRGSFKKKFGLAENEKMVLYLGRINKTKGIALLIQAYANLRKNMKCNNTLLVIAGPDDGYLANAASLVNSSGISNSVLFTGFINCKDKLGALVDADVFVTPSFCGFPLTFLEACAVETPIITTTFGDVLEWIDGNVGYVTSPTHCDLGDALTGVLSDDKLSEKFSMNCRKVVAEFSLNKIVDGLEQIYRTIAEV